MDSSAGSGGLAGRPTGPELCAELAVLDPHTADNEQLLDQLTAQSRQLAYQQAQVWQVMAELAVRDPSPNLAPGTAWTSEQIFASAVEEIRAELRLTRRAAQSELATADGIARLPRVMQALAEGRIDRRRAIVLAEGCAPLTDTQTGVLLDTLLPDAATMTATRLAEKVQQLAMALDPAWAEHRYRHAIRDRKLVGYLNPDGSATVSGQNLPADQAAAACARIDALADAAKRAGAAAKIDHLRADLFLGLLDGQLHGLSEHAIITELLHRYPKTTPAADEDPPPSMSGAAVGSASVSPRNAAARRPDTWGTRDRNSAAVTVPLAADEGGSNFATPSAQRPVEAIGGARLATATASASRRRTVALKHRDASTDPSTHCPRPAGFTACARGPVTQLAELTAGRGPPRSPCRPDLDRSADRSPAAANARRA